MIIGVNVTSFDTHWKLKRERETESKGYGLVIGDNVGFGFRPRTFRTSSSPL